MMDVCLVYVYYVHTATIRHVCIIIHGILYTCMYISTILFTVVLPSVALKKYVVYSLYDQNKL